MERAAPKRPRTAIAYFHAPPGLRAPAQPPHLLVYRTLYRWLRRGRARSLQRSVDYLPALTASLAALRRHHSDLPPVLLLSPRPLEPPPGVDRIAAIDLELFGGFRRLSLEFGFGVYAKLAVLSLTEWNRVVYFDADTIVTGDVSELWDPARYDRAAFYAVLEGPERGGGPPGMFNSGVMVLNRPMLQRRVFDESLRLARRGQSSDRSDQGIFNELLRRDPTLTSGQLSPEFNVFITSRTLNDGILDRFTPRIMHFSGPTKPWSDEGLAGDAEVRRLWRQLTGAGA